MKNIIFCADGTWNGPGQTDDAGMPDPTNVFKLFCNLTGAGSPDTMRLADEEEIQAVASNGSITQVAKYIHGVGDSDNWLVKILGGTIGAGLITRIIRGYTYISRQYQAGDKIFITGFSRGAYTARALAGLICAKGLLDYAKANIPTDSCSDDDKSDAYRLAAAVWYDYRKSVLSANNDLLEELEDLVTDLPAFLSNPPTDALIPNVQIEAVAVWDTVGSMGIPEYSKNGERIDSMRFVNTSLNKLIKRGFHAIAIDEQREDFTPTLWDDDDSVTQVLFCGAHADVGGGYPMENNESGLSDITLAWMTGNLASLGVQFIATPAYPENPNPIGKAHQPWLNVPWNMLARGPRTFPTTNAKVLNLDSSVCVRVKGGAVYADPQLAPCLYDPQNVSLYRIAVGCP